MRGRGGQLQHTHNTYLFTLLFRITTMEMHISNEYPEILRTYRTKMLICYRYNHYSKHKSNAANLTALQIPHNHFHLCFVKCASYKHTSNKKGRS